MEENKVEFTEVKCRCPSCFLTSVEKRTENFAFEDKLCEFCSEPHTDLEILGRQMDVMDFAFLRDLPHVIRNLYLHVQLMGE
jgi:hypothetical protein